MPAGAGGAGVSVRGGIEVAGQDWRERSVPIGYTTQNLPSNTGKGGVTRQFCVIERKFGGHAASVER